MEIVNCLIFAFLVSSTYAGECSTCDKICAREKFDPSNLVTFSSLAKLEAYNANNPGGEYEFAYKGKCEEQAQCPTVHLPICALPAPGVCGPPKTFENMCNLEKHNKINVGAEYEYYHDEDCNKLDPAEAKDCDCLDCDKKPLSPICAIANDFCGGAVSVPSKCWLQQFNCDSKELKFSYFHEGKCYTDEEE